MVVVQVDLQRAAVVAGQREAARGARREQVQRDTGAVGAQRRHGGG
ncbi:hypothetical protein [Catellatospora methionotrophica]